jgi:hypothetical protein
VDFAPAIEAALRAMSAAPAKLINSLAFNTVLQYSYVSKLGRYSAGISIINIHCTTRK